jgi:hypothetical protein
MKRLVLVLALATLATTASADFTKPVRYTWIVTSCESWNHAASALVLADGNPNVMALPTGKAERPWVVLKLVEEGSIYLPEEEPYSCEVMQTVAEGSARFDSMDSCHAPMLLSVPDGRSVVISLKECGNGTNKSRAVRH